MQRQIKFRGQSIKTKQWVYGYYIITDGEHFILDMQTCTMHAVRPETVGQYTGEKDKNGNEIYENDVTQLWFAEKVEFRSKVYFKDAAFQVDRGGIIGNSWELHGWSGQWEIIGNLHDNPELLTQPL